MRGFEHAAASREVAEAVVVRVEFADGSVGWGETLPRPYVTGETIDGVVDEIAERLWPAVAGRPDGSERIRELMDAACAEGRCINAAACALELTCRRWRVGDERAAAISARVSGVLGSVDPGRTAWRLRLMRWYGLRDFKLKLGLGEDVDAENLRVVGRRLARAIRRGRCTLRVDVNGGWPAGEVPQRVDDLRRFGVCVVEQPTTAPAGELAELAGKCALPLIADESLLSGADARALLAQPQRIWWNIRISKNGGLDAALRLARLAAENNVPFAVGCMVGESGILSAAQRRLLQIAPQPRFVEGNYGRFLLADDLTRPSPRFGYAGRLRPLNRPSLGLRVDDRKLQRYGTLVRTVTAS